MKLNDYVTMCITQIREASKDKIGSLKIDFDIQVCPVYLHEEKEWFILVTTDLQKDSSRIKFTLEIP